MHRYFNGPRGEYFDRGYCAAEGFFGNYFGLIHMGIGLLILIVAIIVIAKIIKKNQSGGAIHTLNHLYVTGEITEEAYLKRKEIINKK